MSHQSFPEVAWSKRKEWRPWGDRLDFLSPEARHLQDGKLSILPPRNPEKRDGKEAS